jgi:hypothetical protein
MISPNPQFILSNLQKDANQSFIYDPQSPQINTNDVDHHIPNTSGFVQNQENVNGNTKQKKKYTVFDFVQLYKQAEWIDEVHFKISDLSWDFKTMNNWGFYCNTSLGKGIWYYCWIIRGEGPIFRQGNINQIIARLKPMKGPGCPEPQGSEQIINGRGKLKVPQWRKENGLNKLNVKYIGSKKTTKNIRRNNC